MTQTQEVRRARVGCLKRPAVARLVNIALRGMTLASKFLLVFFLARFLVPQELGLYGLLVAAISYALYLLGFDFYTFSTRELIARGRDDWGKILKSQVALSIISYSVFMPLLILIFWAGWLPWWLAIWFFPVLVLEHINQEVFRLFVAVSQPLKASMLLYLRSGLWPICVVFLMFVFPDFRNLEFVFGAWVVGGTSAVLIGAFWIKGLNVGGWDHGVDWRWIVKGLKVAMPLLVATLALRGLTTFDRYWLESLVGLDVVGAYVLFAGICASLIGFLDAGVFGFIYPSLISAWQKGDAVSFSNLLRKMLWQVLVITLAFAICLALLITQLLSWLDKEIYAESVGLFPYILLGNICFAVGLIPHYALYAQGHDRPLLQSHVVALIVFVIVTLVVSSISQGLAVPVGVVTAFVSILLWKAWCFYRLTPVQFRFKTSL